MEEGGMESKLLVLNGTTYTKSYAGVYEIPVGSIGNLKIGQLAPHTSIDLAGLPLPPSGFEFFVSITNGGDANEFSYLSIFGGVIFSSIENSRNNMARIRAAYLPLVERGELPEAFVPPPTKDRPVNGVSFNVDLGERPDASIELEVQPFLQFFNRVNESGRKVFICHATEDKKVARLIALRLRVMGADVWLDEWEITVGESIFEKVNKAIGDASHIVLLLSKTSVTKPWVTRELSSGFMRYLSNNSVKLVPVLIEECSIPTLLLDLKYADCRILNDSSFQEINKAIFNYGS